MTDPLIGLMSILAILLLIQSGMAIALALMLTAITSVWLITGSLSVAGNLAAMAMADSISSYTFGVIPLFILMGLLISISDVGQDTFQVVRQLFRRVRAGVGMATVAANAVFAAVTGTSIAAAAVFTRIAVPEMKRLGYSSRFSVGVVAGSSVLGMLIPPSLLMIIYGIIAEVSIGGMFTAGIVPGLLLALCYVLLIMGLARFRPGFVGPAATRSDAEMNEGLMPASEMLAKMIPIVSLIVLILGGLYGGLFTPTEAGAVGAGGALLIALARRRLNWRKLWQVLSEAGHVTAAILILLIAAHMYSRTLAMSGLPAEMASWALDSNLELIAIILLYLLAVILLGTILDAVAIILIMVPLILPTLIAHDVNLIWFGILTILAVEIGLLTPPLGISCFVVKANIDDPTVKLTDIFAGAFPFALTMFLVLLLILTWPQIATALL